jgi:DNA-binding transcriptional LysR family regulator
LLRTFCERHPDLAVEMLSSNGSRETVASLNSGEIDAGYSYLRLPTAAYGSHLSSAFVYFEPLQVVVRERHPLANARSIRIADPSEARIWIPGIVTGSEWETFYEELADSFGIDIDSTNYESGSESVFDTISESRSVVTLVGEKSRICATCSTGTPPYPSDRAASCLWRTDTQHAGALLLIEHSRALFEFLNAEEVWLPTTGETFTHQQWLPGRNGYPVETATR